MTKENFEKMMDELIEDLKKDAEKCECCGECDECNRDDLPDPLIAAAAIADIYDVAECRHIALHLLMHADGVVPIAIDLD